MLKKKQIEIQKFHADVGYMVKELEQTIIQNDCTIDFQLPVVYVHCCGYGVNIIGFVFDIRFYSFNRIYNYFIFQEGDSKDNLSLQFSSRIRFDEWAETSKELYDLIAPESKIRMMQNRVHMRLAEDRMV
jgi:hypothetical protein